MKQYVVDQLRPNDYNNLKNHLDEKFGPAQMGSIYWVPLDPGLLSPLQAEHTQCQPHYFSLELDYNRLSAELLIRTLAKVKCQCVAYADHAQRESILAFVDNLLEMLGIST